MSMRYPGGLIASTPVTANYPSGVWTQAQAAPYQAQNVWTRDQFWPYTTLLLQGDGAVNGAQNNTFLDSSSNNFTITRNGNTTQGAFTPYEPEGYWSNYFDGGTSTRLTLPSNAAFAFGTGAYTIEGWVYLNAQSASQASFFEAGTANGALSTSILNTGAVSLGTYGVGAIFSSPANSISPNQWYHIAIVRNSTASNDTKIYVNGSAVATGTDSSNWTVTTTPAVGGINLSGYTLNGYVSNLRVVKGTAVYTSSFTPPTAPLTAITNTSLLTCQSNRFKDNSTNNFTISTSGSPSVQAFQPFPGATTWSASVLGGSGYFDGSGDWLSFGAQSSFNCGTANDFCMEVWAYRIGTSMHFWSAHQGGVADGFYFTSATGAGEYPSLQVYSGGGGGGGVDSNKLMPQYAWSHIVVTRQSGVMRMFLNGEMTGYTTTNRQVNTDGRAVGISGNVNFTGGAGYISQSRYINGSVPTAYQTSSTTLNTQIFTPPTAPLSTTSQGAVANDVKGLVLYANAGIYDNSMMNNLETVGNAQVSTSVVKYGTGSMAFDGSGDYLFAANNPGQRIMSGDFTVEMWMYLGAAQANMGLVSSYENNNGWIVRLDTTYIRFFYGISGSGTANDVTYSFSPGVWYHIAWVKSGTSLRCYINGTQQGSTFTVSGAVDTTTAGMQVGRTQTNTNDFNGYIDDLRITKGAARYLTSFTPPPARMPGQ